MTRRPEKKGVTHQFMTKMNVHTGKLYPVMVNAANVVR